MVLDPPGCDNLPLFSFPSQESLQHPKLGSHRTQPTEFHSSPKTLSPVPSHHQEPEGPVTANPSDPISPASLFMGSSRDYCVLLLFTTSSGFPNAAAAPLPTSRLALEALSQEGRTGLFALKRTVAASLPSLLTCLGPGQDSTAGPALPTGLQVGHSLIIQSLALTEANSCRGLCIVPREHPVPAAVFSRIARTLVFHPQLRG